MAIADDLRARAGAIAHRWEQVVLAEVPTLAALPRSALVDHVPELLDCLATWLAGDDTDDEVRFRALAEGHTLQRHASGIELEAIVAEYAILRRVIVEHLFVPPAPDVSESRVVVQLHGAIDLAICAAVTVYAAARRDVRERVLDILAHDVRDPLTAVMMSSALLADMTLGERQTRLVERITQGARRIERILDDVLDFTRGRLPGGIPIVPELSDMGLLCRQAIEETRGFGPVREVALDASGDLRGMWDPVRVRQVIANLLSNARHYGTGAITVRAWERDDHHAVFASVANTGSVLAPEAIAGLFDPHARKHLPRQRGLGLGLFIVSQIAKAHGGICKATSLDDTTTFTIEWPRVPLP